MKASRKLHGYLLIAAFIAAFSSSANAETLTVHLRRLTSALTSRNLDSIRQFIDPNRIFVEIAPKEGSYLSPSQTLSVIESFFNAHPPISFSYILVKEDGDDGIAIGSLASNLGGSRSTHRVNFGFKKNSVGKWLLIRISIH
jgi:hypothetical protein